MLKLAIYKGMKFTPKKIKPLRFNDKPLGYALETINESFGGLNSTGSYFSEST